MRTLKLLFILAMPLLILAHCGRKNNTFLVFDTANKEPKVNKLTLPIVRGIKITAITTDKISLAWEPIDQVESADDSTPNILFIGYAIYRFARSAFIPKKPLTSRSHSPVEKRLHYSTTKTYYDDTTYLDVFDDHGIREQTTQHICYAVRPIFKSNKKILEGPTSKIVCTKLPE